MRARYLLLIGVLLTAACGQDGIGGTPELTTRERIVGAWQQMGMEESGEFTPLDDGTYIALVFSADGTGGYFPGEGDPVLEEVCSRDSVFTWELTPDESAVLVQFGPDVSLTWRIIDLDAAAFTFDEGSDLFPFARLGECA